MAVLLAGCGGGSEAGTASEPAFKSLRLVLDWDPGPENVGPLLAKQRDYFYDVDLGVEMNTPLAPERPTKYVGGGDDEAAISPAPQVLLAQEEGLPVVIVGSLVPEATMGMVWLPKSGIEGIADLKGKTIAYPGAPFHKDFLEYVLEGAGLTLADVKLEDVGYELVPALASGRADAVFGGSQNEEGAALEARGLDPVVTKATDLGIPEFDELVLIARRDRYRQDPDMFDRLLEASVRGNSTAAADPEAATEAILGQSFGKAARKPAEAGAEATAPLLSRTGETDPEKLERLADWMYEEGMTRRRLPVSALLANP